MRAPALSPAPPHCSASPPDRTQPRASEPQPALADPAALAHASYAMSTSHSCIPTACPTSSTSGHRTCQINANAISSTKLINIQRRKQILVPWQRHITLKCLALWALHTSTLATRIGATNAIPAPCQTHLRNTSSLHLPPSPSLQPCAHRLRLLLTCSTSSQNVRTPASSQTFHNGQSPSNTPVTASAVVRLKACTASRSATAFRLALARHTQSYICTQCQHPLPDITPPPLPYPSHMSCCTFPRASARPISPNAAIINNSKVQLQILGRPQQPQPSVPQQAMPILQRLHSPP